VTAAEVVAAAVVVVEVVVEVVEPQDASSIAATNNKIKLNQVTFLFIFPPFFIYILRSPLFKKPLYLYNEPFYGVVLVVVGNITLILVIPPI
jgi:hypothetical protein